MIVLFFSIKFSKSFLLLFNFSFFNESYFSWSNFKLSSLSFKNKFNLFISSLRSFIFFFNFSFSLVNVLFSLLFFSMVCSKNNILDLFSSNSFSFSKKLFTKLFFSSSNIFILFSLFKFNCVKF